MCKKSRVPKLRSQTIHLKKTERKNDIKKKRLHEYNKKKHKKERNNTLKIKPLAKQNPSQSTMEVEMDYRNRNLCCILPLHIGHL